MGDYKWVDCPVCGAKESMEFKTEMQENFSSFAVDDLEGHFCSECGDGFWTVKSLERLQKIKKKHIQKTLDGIKYKKVSNEG